MNDRDYLRQVPGILRKQPEPFMSYLLTASSHSPFHLPAAERTLRLGSLEGTLLGDYLQAIHYTDQGIGGLVDSLAASGLLERSVLAVFGDHQAFLGATEEVMRTVGASSSGELDRFRNMKQVPFMVRLPHGAAAGARSEAGGGHVDIAPTLMSLLGVDAQGEVMLGKDLTGDGSPLTVFRNGSFTDGRYYFLNRFGAAPSCFDARSGEEVGCEPLRARHAEGLERLHMSDVVLQGNMIPALRRSIRPGASQQCPSSGATMAATD
jgi:phosphoglycerol transferase MdoB-like AlkP superfamily enzyme